MAITNTSWHHLAVTKSGSTVIFYVDGIGYPAPAYNPTFTFTTSAAIGGRADNLDNSFLGAIDEVSVYNTPLSSNQIVAIYNAGVAGKCPLAPLAPVITQQPTNLTVNVGNIAMFAVAATGTAPLSYQWSFNHTNLLDATNALLTLSNVQLTQAGSYSVTVSNIVSSTNSRAAVLTVVNPTPPSCDAPPSGIVAWWPGQGDANDIIGGNNGTVGSGVSFTNGLVGEAFNFQANDLVTISDSPSLDPTNDTDDH